MAVRSYFHLRFPELLGLPVVPRYPAVLDVGVVVVRTVQDDKPAVVEPPSCAPLAGTVVVGGPVVVLVVGAEGDPVVVGQSVGGRARVVRHVELVVVPRPADVEVKILSIHTTTVEIPQVSSQLKQEINNK